MKKLSVVLIILSLWGCEEEGSSAEQEDREQVNAQQEIYRDSQPVPSFEYSLERDVAIQLYQARNSSVATWTVWASETGQIMGDCPSVGFPIPYDTQLTNPLQPVWMDDVDGIAGVSIEQAEPNGLFGSKNSIATWIRCIFTVSGRRVESAIYTEHIVSAYPVPVEVDYERNRIIFRDDQMPNVVIER